MGGANLGDFVEVCSVNDLEDSQGKMVEVNGKQVALFKQGGSFYAINHVCPHAGGPLGEGALNDDLVTCPLHAYQFNIKTGQCQTDPDLSVESYEVKVENDKVMVKV